MRLICLAIVAILSGCASSSSYMVASGEDSNGKWGRTTFSPYYELEHRSDDGAVLARLVITLGRERMPKDYRFTGPFADDIKAAYRGGLIEWVSEVYFINTSSNPVVVAPRSVQVGGAKRTFTASETIPAKKMFITPPAVSLSSSYGERSLATFVYVYGGKEYIVEGAAVRLTVEQLKAKYGGKSA